MGIYYEQMTNGFTVHTKKMLANIPLQRTQFIIEVLHPGRSGVSKKELQDGIAKLYNTNNAQKVIVWGVHNSFGGDKSTGLGLIYDSLDAARRFEPRYRQVRLGLIKKTNLPRKQIKEKKNRAKKAVATRKKTR